MKATKHMLGKLILVVALVILTCALLATSARTEETSHAEKDAGVEKKTEAPPNDKPQEGGGDKKEEAAPSGVGKGKAIIAATQKDGMQISDSALKTLEIKTKPIESKELHKLPLASVLSFQAEYGVYRLRDGWFKLIEGKVISKSSSDATFKSLELKPGDQVVTHGAQLLRLGELNVWSGGGDAD